MYNNSVRTVQLQVSENYESIYQNSIETKKTKFQLPTTSVWHCSIYVLRYPKKCLMKIFIHQANMVDMASRINFYSELAISLIRN